MEETKSYGITDIGTFLLDNSDYIYRMWVYKKVWTPYEMEKKYMDESVYEESQATMVKITNAFEVPGDVMLELQDMDFLEDGTERFMYHKLSEITLERYTEDEKEYGKRDFKDE